MSTPEHILNKIKLLQNLANSPNNFNEASVALAQANKLIEKHGVTEAELKSIEDKKPLWGDDDKLFMSFGIVGWKQMLALTIAKQFYCQVIQEELVPTDGLHQYTYYVYGDLEDVDNVKFAFNTFTKRIEELVEKKCLTKGEEFTSSYTEGLVETINNNIMWGGIDIPNLKSPNKTEVLKDKLDSFWGLEQVPVVKEEKEKPIQETVKTQGPLIKDVKAYYEGVLDGRDFSLEDILELNSENDSVKELPEEKSRPIKIRGSQS